MLTIGALSHWQTSDLHTTLALSSFELLWNLIIFCHVFRMERVGDQDSDASIRAQLDHHWQIKHCSHGLHLFRKAVWERKGSPFDESTVWIVTAFPHLCLPVG